MGVPLAKLGLARSAVLLLRWLREPISEPELDWLIGSGHLAASVEEELALAAIMRQIRRNGQERMQWEIAEFAGRALDTKQATVRWDRRLLAAQNLPAIAACPADSPGMGERSGETAGSAGLAGISAAFKFGISGAGSLAASFGGMRLAGLRRGPDGVGAVCGDSGRRRCGDDLRRRVARRRGADYRPC